MVVKIQNKDKLFESKSNLSLFMFAFMASSPAGTLLLEEP